MYIALKHKYDSHNYLFILLICKNITEIINIIFSTLSFFVNHIHSGKLQPNIEKESLQSLK